MVVKKLKLSDGSWLEMAAGLDKIIHIDCSMWRSKRALQKAIAEELELPREVMAIFNKRDEEDDFYGVEQSVRGVIPSVRKVILNHLHNYKFLVVFHNGSGSYIDLRECGILAAGFMNKRVIWTSRGRFRLHGIQEGNIVKLAGSSDVFMSADISSNQMFDIVWDLLYAEAEEVTKYTGVPEHILSPNSVLECLFYTLLRGDNCIDWGTHAPNYWVCDGIIRADTDGGRSSWQIGEAIHRNIHMGGWHEVWVVNIRDAITLHAQQWRTSDRWITVSLPNLQQQLQDDSTAVHVPPQATSFFWTATILSSNNNNGTMALEACMFRQVDESCLHVLHLSWCTFSFSTPPFLSCSNLRFLLLDHCKDKDATDGSGKMEHHHSYHSEHCFQKLWVLDVSHTDWLWLLSDTHMLLNLDKLRVIAEPKDNGADFIYQALPPLVVFPDLSSSSVLKMVFLDGCSYLEQLGHNALPPSLESFSFVSINAAAKIRRISLRGCAQLKSLLLRGLLGSLVELDLSGTAVKTLNLSVVQAPLLRSLLLLGCEKLQAIIWPQEDSEKPKLDVLKIDTTQTTIAREDKYKKDAWFDFTISLRDARLLRSLMHVRLQRYYVNIEISSIACGNASADARTEAIQGINSGLDGSKQHQVPVLILQKPAGYPEATHPIFKEILQASCSQIAVSDYSDAFTYIPWVSCYISVQDKIPTKLQQDSSTEEESMTTNLPEFVHNKARTMYLHDSMSFTSIPGPSPTAVDYRWNNLTWCRLERCPNIEGTVFTSPSPSDGETHIFWDLYLFWASELQKARYIWNWSTTVLRLGNLSFRNLLFLHIDYCPRIVHVLPLCSSNGLGCQALEVLEIVFCGDLKEVFPSDSSQREFPSLRSIRLHELPKLQSICGRRILAPNLETVKIRGCWSLKRLPAVQHTPCRADKLPTVDCEKEWWDGLEWEGEEADHHPSLYNPSHSAYYKKRLLRPSVLR
ncbi:unnamed protein product [Urochloa decumbens]|uniref:Disease resistance protein At4g27190-like leucine-rich repeats domain-containing protein n=1 Tax=Urochloa decumbens TaxID=240449 RepID=A0ABC8WBU8_9POAL